MRALCIATVLAAAVFSGAAEAGAWTLDRGQFLIMSGVTVSRATAYFDDAGHALEKTSFRKLFSQNWMEYGLTDAVTLFVVPEYVTAEYGSDTQAIVRSKAAAVEGGARILLLSRIGMLSIQGSAKTAGAFGMSVSANNSYGQQYELRLLYGRSYRLFGMDGFFDVQGGLRWIKRPRPDEAVMDATLGLRLLPRTLVMLQSFNMMSRGDIVLPFRPYRLHKMELSVVQDLTRRWALQFGGFLSPAGRNMVQEQGLVAAVWYRV